MPKGWKDILEEIKEKKRKEREEKKRRQEIGYKKDGLEDIDEIDPDDVIALKVKPKTIKSFFKDLIINPGEAAVVIKDGKITDTLTQTKLRKIGGGLTGKLKRIIGKDSGEFIIFTDIREKDIEIPVKETSKDRVEINGICVLRFKLNLDEVQKILNLMKNRDFLTTNDIKRKIKPELNNTFFTKIANYEADEFHGNRDIIRDIESDIYVWMRKTFSSFGIQPIKAFTDWDKSRYEKLKEYEKKKDIRTKKEEVDHKLDLDQIKREHEKVKKEMEEKHDLEIGEVDHQEQIATKRKRKQLERDDMEHDTKMDHKRDKAELASDIADEKMERATEFAEKMHEMDIEEFERKDLAKKEMEQEFKKDQMSMQSEKMEKLMDKALDEGVADSESLQEMMRQQTMRAAVDRESDKVESLSKADAARGNLETYKEAEDKAHEKQNDRMKREAEMMDAAKQDVPDTLVQGDSGSDFQLTKDVDSKSDKSSNGSICSNCGSEVQSGWKACPSCGQDLEDGSSSLNNCPNCGSEVQSGWKACPSCGQDLEEDTNPKCPSCGKEINENWNTCVHCGEIL